MKLIETVGNLAVMCLDKREKCVSLHIEDGMITLRYGAIYKKKSTKCHCTDTDKINKMIEIVREL